LISAALIALFSGLIVGIDYKKARLLIYEENATGQTDAPAVSTATCTCSQMRC